MLPRLVTSSGKSSVLDETLLNTTFTHLSNKYLLEATNVPGTGESTRDDEVNKINDHHCLLTYMGSLGKLENTGRLLFSPSKTVL